MYKLLQCVCLGLEFLGHTETQLTSDDKLVFKGARNTFDTSHIYHLDSLFISLLINARDQTHDLALANQAFVLLS